MQFYVSTQHKSRKLFCAVWRQIFPPEPPGTGRVRSRKTGPGPKHSFGLFRAVLNLFYGGEGGAMVKYFPGQRSSPRGRGLKNGSGEESPSPRVPGELGAGRKTRKGEVMA